MKREMINCTFISSSPPTGWELCRGTGDGKSELPLKQIFFFLNLAYMKHFTILTICKWLKDSRWKISQSVQINFFPLQVSCARALVVLSYLLSIMWHPRRSMNNLSIFWESSWSRSSLDQGCNWNNSLKK